MKKVKEQKEEKKCTVDNLGENIAVLIHTGLRKWCDDPNSGEIWRLIHEMEDGQWENLCRLVANEIYTPMRKAFKKQLK